MKFKDYYAVLGVDRNASRDEVKRAYRRLAQKYHPDRNPSSMAEARFKDAKEAYEVLGDPEKRARYDALGRGYRAGDEVGGPAPGGFDAEAFSREFRNSTPGGFSEFFRAFFGDRDFGWKERPAAVRGADRSGTLEVTVADLAIGGKRPCVVRDADGSARQLMVNLPAGIGPGKKIRLAGQGAPGRHGGSAGDLLLTVTPVSGDGYSLEGRDIHHDLPITPWEAALGAKVPVHLPGGGIAQVNVPAGTQSGKRLRLRGRGLPGEPPGDFYVRLQIHTPPAHTTEAREFYEEMRSSLPFDPRKAKP
ncbi:MAG: DnaJ C-terminal domain-containing protein [Halothiobacillaceae bacterium]